MKHMMTYHNIRNMIWQLEQSGGYGNGCFISGVRKTINSNFEMIEFTYSEDTTIGEDKILCIMSKYESNPDEFVYEILISVREIIHSNLGLHERNLVYIRLRSNDPYKEMEVIESPDYSSLRMAIHLMDHKATRKLVNRIYNRMMIPEMHKQVAESVHNELERRKELKND